VLVLPVLVLVLPDHTAGKQSVGWQLFAGYPQPVADYNLLQTNPHKSGQQVSILT